MVVEADESDGSFLKLPHEINIITNIDIEHLDYYKKNSTSPKKIIQKGKSSYFKKISKLDSKININQSLIYGIYYFLIHLI